MDEVVSLLNGTMGAGAVLEHVTLPLSKVSEAYTVTNTIRASTTTTSTSILYTDVVQGTFHGNFDHSGFTVECDARVGMLYIRCGEFQSRCNKSFV
jgi:hypothetical protein